MNSAEITLALIDDLARANRDFTIRCFPADDLRRETEWSVSIIKRGVNSGIGESSTSLWNAIEKLHERVFETKPVSESVSPGFQAGYRAGQLAERNQIRKELETLQLGSRLTDPAPKE